MEILKDKIYAIFFKCFILLMVPKSFCSYQEDVTKILYKDLNAKSNWMAMSLCSLI